MTPIASDLSQEVLKRRRSQQQFPLPRFDRGYEPSKAYRVVVESPLRDQLGDAAIPNPLTLAVGEREE